LRTSSAATRRHIDCSHQEPLERPEALADLGRARGIVNHARPEILDLIRTRVFILCYVAGSGQGCNHRQRRQRDICEAPAAPLPS
jgi:hypothetical protein